MKNKINLDEIYSYLKKYPEQDMNNFDSNQDNRKLIMLEVYVLNSKKYLDVYDKEERRLILLQDETTYDFAMYTTRETRQDIEIGSYYRLFVEASTGDRIDLPKIRIYKWEKIEDKDNIRNENIEAYFEKYYQFILSKQNEQIQKKFDKYHQFLCECYENRISSRQKERLFYKYYPDSILDEPWKSIIGTKSKFKENK